MDDDLAFCLDNFAADSSQIIMEKCEQAAVDIETTEMMGAVTRVCVSEISMRLSAHSASTARVSASAESAIAECRRAVTACEERATAIVKEASRCASESKSKASQSALSEAKQKAERSRKAVAAASAQMSQLESVVRAAQSLDKMMDNKWNHDYCKDSKTHGSAAYGWPGGGSKVLERGGEPYYCPKGWRRYGVKVDNFDSRFKHWAVAYHGTKSKNALSILTNGLLPPGHGGVQEGLGQWGAEKPSIYATPSVEYAGNPVYSRVYQKDDRHLQMVFQLRVGKPIKKQGDKSGLWDKVADPNFEGKDRTIEWLYEDPSQVQVYGMMIREMTPELEAKWDGVAGVCAEMPPAKKPAAAKKASLEKAIAKKPAAAKKASLEKAIAKKPAAAKKASLEKAIAKKPAAADKIKKSPGPFMIFCKEMRPKIKQENPGITFGEISKKLGAAWHKLSNAQKAKYKK